MRERRKPSTIRKTQGHGDAGTQRIIRHRFVLLSGFLALMFLSFIPVCYPDQPPHPVRRDSQSTKRRDSQSTKAPTNVAAFDTPDDDGSSITIEWELSANPSLSPRARGDVRGGENDVIAYIILRASQPADGMKAIGRVEAGSTRYVDNKVTRGNSYYYIVQAQDRAGSVANSVTAGPVVAVAQWFNKAQTPTAISIIIFSGVVIFHIYRAKFGKQPFIRRISGLEAIDEAIGRATEMGKPALYISGTGSIKSIATIASMNILARVARMTAKYDTPLYVPCSDAVVMNIEREIVQNAHTDVGRPDTYKQENIFFITEEQFAYAAAVDGIIVRDRPAAIFYIGAFLAESLILTEVGNAIGAIQIAGTDSITQLPFFIATCDYTLMGEELYAASAYLSKEPLLLGSLRGQDWGKLLAIAAILAGVILQIAGFSWFIELFHV